MNRKILVSLVCLSSFTINSSVIAAKLRILSEHSERQTAVSNKITSRKKSPSSSSGQIKNVKPGNIKPKSTNLAAPYLPGDAVKAKRLQNK